MQRAVKRESGTTREVAPPGFEHVVKGLKGKVKNPYATAWSMHGRGYKPHAASGKPHDPEAMLRRHQHEIESETHDFSPMADVSEANGSTAAGALLGKGVRESLRESGVSRGTYRFNEFTRLKLREADAPATEDGKIPVVIITEGPGNRRDRNLYTAAAIQSSAQVFEGVKCFLNHPSVSEERDRPERRVQDQAGWFSECRAEVVDGKACAVGNLNLSLNPAGKEQARGLIESERAYQQQFPNGDNVFVGFSINAEGTSHEEVIDGEPWHVVDAIAAAMSCDLVTFPARGGRLREAEADFDSWRWRDRFLSTLKRAA